MSKKNWPLIAFFLTVYGTIYGVPTNEASQTINYSVVTNSDTIEISGDVSGLTLVQGEAPITNSTTTYSVTTGGTTGGPTRFITVRATTPVPTGITLQADLSAPAAGGSSSGATTVNSTDSTVVTSIPSAITTASQGGITYNISADNTATLGPSQSITVLYTISVNS